MAYILDRRRRQAGIRRFSPHDLRRSHISHLLDLGVDLATASAEIGHASVQQTGCYDRRSELGMIRAAGLLGPTIGGESQVRFPGESPASRQDGLARSAGQQWKE